MRIFNDGLVLSLVILVGVLSFYIITSNPTISKELENFVAPTVEVLDQFDLRTPEALECETEIDYDIYKLNELYFKENDTLIWNVVIHYFANDTCTNLSEKYVRDRLDMATEFFMYSNFKIKFEIIDYNEYTKPPIYYPELLQDILTIESLVKAKREDLREAFYMDHVYIHNNVFAAQNALNIYIYGNEHTGAPSKAGDIESTYFRINERDLHHEYYSVEHEAGHTIGLFHTHKRDISGLPHSNLYGDKVCDTHITFPMHEIIDKDCDLIENWEKTLRLETFDNPIESWDGITDSEIDLLKSNVMSYTRRECRKEISYYQIKRCKKIIETNRDVRGMFRGLEENYETNIFNKLKEVR